MSGLAAGALARLITPDGRVGVRPSAVMFDKVFRAVVSPDEGVLEALKPELRRRRVSDSDLADVYFPQIARTLGEDWEMDRVSFATLSIAVARMQAFLRDVGESSAGGEGHLRAVATVLLIVPQGEAHTLGPMTVLGQLRRRGVSVSLRIAAGIDDIAAALSGGSYDGAIVSVACREQLALCCKLVRALKQGSGGTLPVALGGAVLLAEDHAFAATGADIATNDLTAALAAFGLALPDPSPMPDAGDVAARSGGAGSKRNRSVAT